MRAHGRISEATAQFSCNGDASGIRPYTVAALDTDSPAIYPPPTRWQSHQGSPSTPRRPLHALHTGPARPNALMYALADAVRSCTGSLAIAGQREHDPDALLLGVRGSTRSLYIGLAPNSWIVTSEPYGLIGNAERYLRLVGVPRRTIAAGSVAILRRNATGELAGIERHHIDGRPHPVDAVDIESVEITTRNRERLGYGTFTPRDQRRRPA